MSYINTRRMGAAMLVLTACITAIALSGCGSNSQTAEPISVVPTDNTTQQPTQTDTAQPTTNQPTTDKDMAGKAVQKQAESKTTAKPTNAPKNEAPSKIYVTITKNGFSPSNARVSVGQSIILVNKDTATHWPYSMNYPLFDAGHALKTDETYGFIFKSAGVIAISDRLSDNLKGTITVR